MPLCYSSLLNIMPLVKFVVHVCCTEYWCWNCHAGWLSSCGDKCVMSLLLRWQKDSPGWAATNIDSLHRGWVVEKRRMTKCRPQQLAMLVDTKWKIAILVLAIQDFVRCEKWGRYNFNMDYVGLSHLHQYSLFVTCLSVTSLTVLLPTKQSIFMTTIQESLHTGPHDQKCHSLHSTFNSSTSST